jgi:hypothetical protein
MIGMFPAGGAIFVKLQPGGIILSIFSGSIGPLLTSRAGEMNDYSIFTLFSHFSSERWSQSLRQQSYPLL